MRLLETIKNCTIGHKSRKFATENFLTNSTITTRMKNIKKKICLCVFFMLQAIGVFADPGDPTPVILTPKNDEDIVVNTKPHKSPILQGLLPKVYWDSDESCLAFVADNVTYGIEYVILDTDENETSRGVISFDEDGIYSINLSGMPIGQYVVRITIANITYEGTFYIS